MKTNGTRKSIRVENCDLHLLHTDCHTDTNLRVRLKFRNNSAEFGSNWVTTAIADLPDRLIAEQLNLKSKPGKVTNWQSINQRVASLTGGDPLRFGSSKLFRRVWIVRRVFRRVWIECRRRRIQNKWEFFSGSLFDINRAQLCFVKRLPLLPYRRLWIAENRLESLWKLSRSLSDGVSHRGTQLLQL